MPENIAFDSWILGQKELEQSLFAFSKKKLASPCSADGDISIHTLLRSRHNFLTELRRALCSGEFNLSPAKQVLYPGTKPRSGYAFSLIDQFTYFHFARAIEHFTAPRLPPTLHSFRPGYSNHRTVEEAASFIRSIKTPLFITRRDVRSFGDNLDHSLIEEDFIKWCSPGEIALRLFQCLAKFPFREGEIIKITERGLPTGSHIQLLMENLYLVGLDRAMEKHDLFYRRFGDDILLLSPIEDSWKIARDTIDLTLFERKLEANSEKSFDALLVPPHKVKVCPTSFIKVTQFSYLGSVIRFNGSYGLSKTKVRTVRRFLRDHLSCALRNRNSILGSESFEARRAALIATVQTLVSESRKNSNSPLTHFLRKIHDETLLKELDRWLGLMILSLASNKGYTQGRFHLTSFGTLRREGLPSLLHLRRTGGL